MGAGRPVEAHHCKVCRDENPEHFYTGHKGLCKICFGKSIAAYQRKYYQWQFRSTKEVSKSGKNNQCFIMSMVDMRISDLKETASSNISELDRTKAGQRKISLANSIVTCYRLLVDFIDEKQILTMKVKDADCEL